MSEETRFEVRPVGFVRSTVLDRTTAPRQGSEGAPDAWVDLEADFADAAADIKVGDEIILLTWFHEGRREVQKVHPRSIPGRPLTGVFSTRSPDRPNPIGLHRVTVLEIDGLHVHVEPLEAIDGTPVIDIKPVFGQKADY